MINNDNQSQSNNDQDPSSPTYLNKRSKQKLKDKHLLISNEDDDEDDDEDKGELQDLNEIHQKKKVINIIPIQDSKEPDPFQNSDSIVSKKINQQIPLKDPLHQKNQQNQMNIQTHEKYYDAQSPKLRQQAKNSMLQTKRDSNIRFQNTINVTDNVVKGMFQQQVEEDYTLKRVNKSKKRYNHQDKNNNDDNNYGNDNLQYISPEQEQQNRKSLAGKLPPLKESSSIEILKHEGSTEKDRKVKEFLQKDRMSKIKSDQIINVKSFITTTIPSRKYIQCHLRRNKDGLNLLYPKYNLVLADEQKYLGSAKSLSCQSTSTYSLTSDSIFFEENSQQYIGYVKGNFIGSIFNIYDEIDSKSPIATISYENNTDENNAYRNIEIYLLNQNYIYSDLDGNYNGTLNLKQLFNQGENQNQKRIFKFINKKPQWNQNTNRYQLNFHGKVLIPSVKNMIIIHEDKPEKQLLLIGKQQSNLFNLYITYPFSIRIAMGFLMSSFAFKLVCE